MTTPASFQNVTKRYGNFLALSDLTFSIEQGECIVLLGPNGAGKTTAIRMLLGLLTPTSGNVSLFGNPPSDPEARKRVGYLPGEMGWPLGVKCGEWIQFLADLSGSPQPNFRRELLDRLAFPQSRLNSYMGSLSQGMKRKLGLVAALEPQPELLVLDEPGDGLDPLQQRALIDLLRDRRENISLLLSTHDLREAFELADRIAIFATGRLATILPRSDVSSINDLEHRFFAEVVRV
jgi:ABC-2 type transport system ATP-binding protein